MRTKIVEAVQSNDWAGNWGKFLVMVPDTEWSYQSRIDKGRSLMHSMGYWGGPTRIWVLDMQTGEGAFFEPTGSAKADLNKHQIWVCPLYEPFLGWLYAWHKEKGDIELDDLPEVVELPKAKFSQQGYRRPGNRPVFVLATMDDFPEEIHIPKGSLDIEGEGWEEEEVQASEALLGVLQRAADARRKQKRGT